MIYPDIRARSLYNKLGLIEPPWDPPFLALISHESYYPAGLFSKKSKLASKSGSNKLRDLQCVSKILASYNWALLNNNLKKFTFKHIIGRLYLVCSFFKLQFNYSNILIKSHLKSIFFQLFTKWKDEELKQKGTEKWRKIQWIIIIMYKLSHYYVQIISLLVYDT